MQRHEEEAVPVCGRKAMAAADWPPALLGCGWSWKPELWGRDSLLRGSHTDLAWPSWMDSGWQVVWLSRTGVGREAGKKRSLCSLVYLGVVGASPTDCWRQKEGKVVTTSEDLLKPSHASARLWEQHILRAAVPKRSTLLHFSNIRQQYLSRFLHERAHPSQSHAAVPQGFRGFSTRLLDRKPMRR